MAMVLNDNTECQVCDARASDTTSLPMANEPGMYNCGWLVNHPRQTELKAGIDRVTAHIEMRTERLLLRPFRLTDVDDVYAYASDTQWGRFLPVPDPYLRKDAEEFVARSIIRSWDTQPLFAICLDDAVIGAIDVRVDVANKTAEVGYSISRAHWGKGMMAEAATAVIDWAFSEFELVKVGSRADLENRQSWRVMEKLGMTREGVLRSARTSVADPCRREDTVHYGVLREEWRQRSVD